MPRSMGLGAWLLLLALPFIPAQLGPTTSQEQGSHPGARVSLPRRCLPSPNSVPS